ncbi:D-glycero-alpha-D-manno-heptose 1-phosphate guanylyltransferase [Actinomadura rubteroloni]|uniref:D-glycero-alpha-D-manno-heptose 1-phosphate guanylyltransferase n=1 Tax=Actinomadura rubteroloni TaxID=1926885 RepID=A0A2P4UPH5_9ACTN|nr:NDP-sugar synthase [Actinomadura rubteroloni]POM26956.1 D-glycero-alpha-D-manno-heptose 1-phosphate guanylyltransferase [Actinomadura rubteroloni]
MEAILLVGGRGTRLRPLTISTPKPLLPTAGVAFLAHQLARASALGVTRIVFATSYRAEMFEAAFGTSAYGVELCYVSERQPLGTGGAIRNASTALESGPDDPVLILNGDILSGHDVKAQAALHTAAEADVTLHLTEVEDPRRFGVVPTDASGRVTAFLEKTARPATNQVNAGCYVFRRSAIDTIEEGEVVSVERETFPSLIASGATVMGYVESAYWLDVGTPEAFVQGSRDLVLGKLSSPAMPGDPGQRLVLDRAVVARGAVVRGGTTVGRGAVIEAGATVIGSVLLDDAFVAEGATVRDSVLSRGARVGPGATLDGVILGDAAVVGPGNELRDGLRLWPGIELPATAVRFSTDA